MQIYGIRCSCLSLLRVSSHLALSREPPIYNNSDTEPVQPFPGRGTCCNLVFVQTWLLSLYFALCSLAQTSIHQLCSLPRAGSLLSAWFLSVIFQGRFILLHCYLPLDFVLSSLYTKATVRSWVLLLPLSEPMQLCFLIRITCYWERPMAEQQSHIHNYKMPSISLTQHPNIKCNKAKYQVHSHTSLITPQTTPLQMNSSSPCELGQDLSFSLGSH